jgi:transcriptional regulator with XRE-family HTH domain
MQMQINEQIRKKRKELGMSQEELAKLIGATQANISWWESGEVEPKASSLRRLAEVFGCTVDDFING